MATPHDFADLILHSEKPPVYFSPPIIARRRRLLRETRHMIAEDGLENFRIQKVCERAGVAQKTLYNAFQSKDRLIAFAIHEAYDEFRAHLRTRSDAGTLKGLLTYSIAINRRNFQARNYIKAACAIYFSPTTSLDVWQMLHDMSLRGISEWMGKRRSDLNPWVDVEEFAHAMANIQYSTINDWCLGRLSDDDYLPRLAENMLLLIVGSAQGELAAEAAQYLDSIKRTGNVDAIAPAVAVTRRKRPKSIDGVATSARPSRRKSND